jgi:Kef-type K+ transport system membrane component KefB/nucleotide-binding universal stress UspA family protein
MSIAEYFHFSLPLSNPILIFSVILFVILFSPIILNKMSIPPLVGLIIAGVIIGPNGFNFIDRDSSIELFGTVGLLYLMFMSSMEMDVGQFKRNSGKSLVFGIYTFVFPMLIGTLSGVFILKFSWITSILLASMYASNTLITYPIVSKLGIVKNRAVNISVGATVITTVAALLVLAVIVSMHTGEIGPGFWFKLIVSMIISSSIILFVFPALARWFFKRFDDNVTQYIFVLGLVFMGAFLAQVAGIEPIIGAFLVGLALNRLIPNTSPLMNRIEFVGSALFIPFFLIGVGMLIDFRIFFNNIDAIVVALVMTVVATTTKYLAAWMTQKTFSFSVNERRVMFGLTNAQAASTLAAIIVGYNVIIGYTDDGFPIRLLNESVLNGTILMILITCTIASFATQKGAQNIALEESSSEEVSENEIEERILIPFSNSETVEELVNLSVTVKSEKKNVRLIGLHILDDLSHGSTAEKEGEKLMEKAEKIAASTDNTLSTIIRYDSNVVNGIVNVVKENKITDLIIGLHQKKGLTDSYLGALAQGVLNHCDTTTMIYRPEQPLSTVKRYLIFVPDNAEKEIGFPFWLVKIWNIGRNTGAKLIFYGSSELIEIFRGIQQNHPIEADFVVFKDWDDFLVLSRDIKPDDGLVFVLSRKNYQSYHHLMARIPYYLNNYFEKSNFLLIYPRQLGADKNVGFDPTTSSMFDPLTNNIERFDGILKTIGKLISRK